ncbi:hypothetical protein [Blastococcus sp. SYSU D00813]
MADLAPDANTIIQNLSQQIANLIVEVAVRDDALRQRVGQVNELEPRAARVPVLERQLAEKDDAIATLTARIAELQRGDDDGPAAAPVPVDA